MGGSDFESASHQLRARHGVSPCPFPAPFLKYPARTPPRRRPPHQRAIGIPSPLPCALVTRSVLLKSAGIKYHGLTSFPVVTTRLHYNFDTQNRLITSRATCRNWVFLNIRFNAQEMCALIFNQKRVYQLCSPCAKGEYPMLPNLRIRNCCRRSEFLILSLS